MTKSSLGASNSSCSQTEPLAPVKTSSLRRSSGAKDKSSRSIHKKCLEDTTGSLKKDLSWKDNTVIILK